MFGYSQQQFARIKAFADMQFLEDTHDVSVDNGFMDINSPWIDDSGRFELTDIGAVQLYGEELLKKFCEKADIALQNDAILARLKEWSEKTVYHPKYPWKNPVEKFGLKW